MRATAEIKCQLMRRYGWTAIRRDRRGNWWVRGAATPETHWRRRWERRPLWTDEEIEEMLADGRLTAS